MVLRLGLPSPLFWGGVGCSMLHFLYQLRGGMLGSEEPPPAGTCLYAGLQSLWLDN